MNEVQMLVDTPCKDDVLKRAFLFSILTGLRHSDIQALKWKQIQQTSKGSKRQNDPIISQSFNKPFNYAVNAQVMMKHSFLRD
jgi:hypothetical protein